MPWVAGADTQVSKPRLLQGCGHIEREILLDIRLGAFQQGGNSCWQSLQHRRSRVLIHHHKHATRPEQTGGFAQYRMGRTLGKLVTDELQADQIKGATRQTGVLRSGVTPLRHQVLGVAHPCHRQHVR